MSLRTTVDENGHLHSFNDAPARLPREDSYYGEREWFEHGLRHRGDDKPAIVYRDGTKLWFIKDCPHRVNGSQVEWPDGGVIYYLFGFQLDEDEYFKILSESARTGYPLWVSWLLVLGAIEPEQLELGLNENGKWAFAFPAEWFLRVWDIQPVIFDYIAVGARKHTWGSEGVNLLIKPYKTTPLHNMNRFLTVVNYMEVESQQKL